MLKATDTLDVGTMTRKFRVSSLGLMAGIMKEPGGIMFLTDKEKKLFLTKLSILEPGMMVRSMGREK